jgi:peroxiredoxin
MKSVLAFIVALSSLAGQAWAALDVGAKAPDFSAPAALGGKAFTFSLAESLAKGPVVLYFFPAAFTQGCTIEAHDFAEATPKFAALGASVVGVSTDDIEKLSQFSVQACQSKFPLASDSNKRIVKAYDAAMAIRPDYASRISYVIAPNGAVLASYASLSPDQHVEKMLAAVRQWRESNPSK